MKMSRSVKCVICLNNGDFESGKCNGSWKTMEHPSFVNVLEKLFGVRITSRPSLARTLPLCTDCWNIFSTLSPLLILIKETQLKIDEHLKTVEGRVVNSQEGGWSQVSEETVENGLWDEIRQGILHYFDKENNGCEIKEETGMITNLASVDIFQTINFDEIKAEAPDDVFEGHESVGYDDCENVEVLSFSNVQHKSDSEGSAAGQIDVVENSSLTYTRRPSRRRRKRFVGTKRKKSTQHSRKGWQKSKPSISMQRTEGKSNLSKPESEVCKDLRRDELADPDKKQSNANKRLELSLLKQWNLLQSPQPRIVLVDVYKNTEMSTKLMPLSKRKRVSTFKSSPFISFMQSDSEDEGLLIKKLKPEKDQDEDFQPILADSDGEVSSFSDSNFSLLEKDVSSKDRRQDAASIPKRKMKSSINPKQTRTRNNRESYACLARKKKPKPAQLDPNDEYLSKLILKNGMKYYNRKKLQNIDDCYLCVFEGCDYRTTMDELNSLRTLVKHLETDHKDDNRHRCTYCDLFFRTNKELMKHKKLEHPGCTGLPKVECNICGKPVQKYYIKKHQWLHMNEEEREAAIASGNALPSELQAAVTNRKKLINDRFSCTLCDRTFPFKHYLTAHEIVHKTKEERQKYICETCGEVYTTTAGFNLHMKREHNPELLLTKWKYCKICNQRFYLRTKLDSHMRSFHGVEWIHHCTICQRKFPSQTAVQRHGIVHKPDFRPHACQYCDMKPYRRATHLRRHMKSKHPDEPIVFSESYMSQLKKSISKDPIVVMTCKQMYPCLFPKCEKIFELPSRLKKHCKISHPSYEQPMPSSTQLQQREQSSSDDKSTVNLQEVGISTHVEPLSSGSNFDQTIKPNGEEIDRAVQYLIPVQY